MPYAVAAVAIAVIGIGVDVAYTEDANRKAKHANERAQRIENIKAQRERVNAIREARSQAAQIQATAANEGTGDSSGVQGAVGSIGSGLNSNINFADQVNTLNADRLRAISESDRSRVLGNEIGGGLQTIGSAVSSYGAYQSAKK